MALVRVPPNCAGMTLASAGAIVATNNIITVPSAVEATALISPYAYPGSIPVQKTAANGDVTFLFPTVVTNITIGGVGYAVNAGVSAPIPAAPAAAFINGGKYRRAPFELVNA